MTSINWFRCEVQCCSLSLATIEGFQLRYHCLIAALTLDILLQINYPPNEDT